MIEHDPNTLIAKCLDCGYEFIRKNFPKECSRCRIPSHRYRKRELYLTTKSHPIKISSILKARLNRRKLTPYESYASIIDRMVNNNVSTTLMYDHKQMKVAVNVEISGDAHTKLKELKIQYKIATFNEMLWRML